MKPKMFRRANMVLALSGLIAAGSLTPANAAATNTDASGLPTLTIMSSSDEAVPDAIIAEAANDPAFRETAVTLVTYWIAHTSDENPMSFAAADGSIDAYGPADLQNTLNELQAPPDTMPHLRSSTSGTHGLTARSAVTGDEPDPEDTSIPVDPGPDPDPGTTPGGVDNTASEDPNNPNTFPVRGTPGSGKLYWTGLTLHVEITQCNSSCGVTDRYTSQVTINPGATSSTINTQNLYSPNTGYFNGTFISMFAVCRGTVCQHKNTGVLPPSGRDGLNAYGNRHSNVLTIAVAYYVRIRSSGRWIYVNGSGSKTHDATCEASAVGNACKYN